MLPILRMDKTFSVALEKRMVARHEPASFHIADIFQFVIVPEIIVHMTSLDLRLNYDEALELLSNPNLLFYGSVLTEFMEFSRPKRGGREDPLQAVDDYIDQLMNL